jgi:hypothetical protein
MYEQMRLHTRYLKATPNICWGTLLVAKLVEALRYKSEGRAFDP